VWLLIALSWWMFICVCVDGRKMPWLRPQIIIWPAVSLY